MKENKFPENLKKLRKKFKLSQEDLGQKINISKQTISKYEKGFIEPNFHTLIEISRVFNCSLDELVFGNLKLKNKNPVTLNIEIEKKLNLLKSEITSTVNNFFEYENNLDKKHIENKNEFSEELSPYIPSNNVIDLDFYSKTKVIKSISLYDLKDNEDYLKLPCIGNVSAGYPMYACEDIERYFYIPKEYIKHSEDEYFILRIKGESMNKIYKNGDYVLVHKTCCIDENKPSVVLVNNDEATVKYVMLDDEYFYLQPYSDNPKFQENIRYKSDENTLNIVGTVIGVVFEEEK